MPPKGTQPIQALVHPHIVSAANISCRPGVNTHTSASAAVLLSQSALEVAALTHQSPGSAGAQATAGA
jgi:hypothetical protein